MFEIAALALAGYCLFRSREVPAGTWFPLLVLGFIVLWGCLQLITGSTVSRFATTRALLMWMTWVAVYYVGIATLHDERSARIIRTGIVWFGFAVATEAILQNYVSPGLVFGLFPTGYHDFVMGPIVYHTHFAAFVETILPIALVFALRGERGSYNFLLVSAVLLAAVVVSASRGGLILVVVEVLAVVVLAYLQGPRAGLKTARTARTTVILVGMTSILMLIVGFATAAARFSSQPLTMGRIQFAVSTLHMIAMHPVVGWGLGCWPSVYPAFASFDAGAIVNQAHCDWLQWTAEGGLPVGISMLALLLWAVRPAVRSIWGIGVLIVFVHAAFDYPFSRPALGAWPILILSMIAVHPAQGRSPVADKIIPG